MKTSYQGRQYIKDDESLRLKSYLDSAGVWTIGWGSTRGVTSGMTITESEAEARFTLDLKDAEDPITKLVRVPLTQEQFDVLVSWEFNTGGLRGSTLLKVLNAGEYDRVDDELRRWVYATDKKTGKKFIVTGLKNRRGRESGRWSAATPQTLSRTVRDTDSGVTAEPQPVRPIDSTSKAGVAIATGSTIATMVSETAQTLQPIAEHSATIRIVFTVLLLVGLGITMWAIFRPRSD